MAGDAKARWLFDEARAVLDGNKTDDRAALLAQVARYRGEGLSERGVAAFVDAAVLARAHARHSPIRERG